MNNCCASVNQKSSNVLFLVCVCVKNGVVVVLFRPKLWKSKTKKKKIKLWFELEREITPKIIIIKRRRRRLRHLFCHWIHIHLYLFGQYCIGLSSDSVFIFPFCSCYSYVDCIVACLSDEQQISRKTVATSHIKFRTTQKQKKNYIIKFVSNNNNWIEKMSKTSKGNSNKGANKDIEKDECVRKNTTWPKLEKSLKKVNNSIRFWCCYYLRVFPPSPLHPHR